MNAEEKTGEDSKIHSICVTCGSQFGASATVPEECPICLDPRQYVGANGQQWTDMELLREGKFRNDFQELEPGLWSIRTEPRFAIGQRALLIQSEKGNVLWDCVSYLDDDTISKIRDLGGISQIAISHPHYYSSMVDWSGAFDNAPIHIHQNDQQWVQRPDDRIVFWTGKTKVIGEGLTLIATGGHFDGFQVLHHEKGVGGNLYSGDQPQICADPSWVSFMYSYPNYIPLDQSAIRGIVEALSPFSFDRIYSAFRPGIVEKNAKAIVMKSAKRYLEAIQ